MAGTHYTVETLEQHGLSLRWTVHRYASLAAAIRFRDKESKRLGMGLEVARVNPDLSCDYLTGSGGWFRLRSYDYTPGGHAMLSGSDSADKQA
jgi:hypothetical protein